MRHRAQPHLHDAGVVVEDLARLQRALPARDRADVPQADLRVVRAAQQVPLQEGAPRQPVAARSQTDTA